MDDKLHVLHNSFTLRIFSFKKAFYCYDHLTVFRVVFVDVEGGGAHTIRFGLLYRLCEISRLSSFV